MFKEEAKSYLFEMYNDLKDIDQKLIDFRVNLHNLDKLGYNVEAYNKLLDNVGIELYKLKNYNNDYSKERLKNWQE